MFVKLGATRWLLDPVSDKYKAKTKTNPQCTVSIGQEDSLAPHSVFRGYKLCRGSRGQQQQKAAPSMSASHHRSHVLALYRAFLREAKQMPTGEPFENAGDSSSSDLSTDQCSFASIGLFQCASHCPHTALHVFPPICGNALLPALCVQKTGCSTSRGRQAMNSASSRVKQTLTRSSFRLGWRRRSWTTSSCSGGC